MNVNMHADRLGEMLLPGIRQAIFDKVEKEVVNHAERIVREVIDDACRMIVKNMTAMESMSDRSVVIRLEINGELAKEYK